MTNHRCHICHVELDPDWGYVVINNISGCLDCFAMRNGAGLMYAIRKEVQNGQTA